MSAVSLLAQLDWNSRSAECFPLPYYQNGFKGAMPRFSYFAGWLLGV